MTKELPMFKTKSHAKAIADEKMNIAEMLIKRTWTIVKRCRRLMNMDMENLKKIKEIIYQGELFTSANKTTGNKKSMDKCLESLTETF